jgi:hypothetical protein
VDAAVTTARPTSSDVVAFCNLRVVPGTRGRLLRSEMPHGLDDASRASVAQVRTVLDLRSHAELQHDGPTFLTGATTVHLPFGEVEGSRRVPPPPIEDVAAYGGWFLELGGAALVAVIQELATCALPALMHCMAGKDRTGAAAAVVLDLLGADREVIVEDFLATEPALPELLRRFWALASSAASANPVPPDHLPVDRAVADSMLDLLEAEGGAAGWLRNRGVAQKTLDAVIARLS